MAKPKPIVGLTPELSYGETAARAVETRGGELLDHATGVLDTHDIERVHDMRVASRRLRAALEVFEPCFPKKAYARTLSDLKELADGLGERRDRDVAIEALDKFAAAMSPAGSIGVERMVSALREEQAEANSDLAPLVADERLVSLADQLGRLVEAARRKGRVQA